MVCDIVSFNESWVVGKCRCWSAEIEVFDSIHQNKNVFFRLKVVLFVFAKKIHHRKSFLTAEKIFDFIRKIKNPDFHITKFSYFIF